MGENEKVYRFAVGSHIGQNFGRVSGHNVKVLLSVWVFGHSFTLFHLINKVNWLSPCSSVNIAAKPCYLPFSVTFKASRNNSSLGFLGLCRGQCLFVCL